MIMNIQENNLSKRLRKVREEKGFTREKLAREADISTSALYNYERGTQEPTVSVLNKISSILNVSVDYLLGNTDEPLPTSTSGEELKSQIIDEIISNLSKENKKKVNLETLKKELNDSLIVARRVPYLNSIPVGTSLEDAINDAKETFLVPKGTEIDFALKIQDDAMKPELKSGDIALCAKVNKLEKGEIGVFIHNKQGGIVRKYAEYGDTIVLRAENENLENNEIVISKREFRREWKIAAKVVGVFQTFEKETNDKV